MHEACRAMDWAVMDRTARDAAYDNAGAVAGSAGLSAERNAASAAFRTAHPAALDLRYGPAERQKWDLFPAADPQAPCLVFIHGGYWQRNGREGFAALAEGVRAHGWSVALPGYTLAPEATLSAIVAEMDAALDWLARAGAAHGVGGKVLVSGWSAGGHLAAMALSHPHVTAGLAISGVYELAPLRDTGLNHALTLTDAEVATLSPLRLPPVEKPLAIAYGTAELPALVADSRALHARRAAAHCPGPLVPVAGANHFTILDTLRAADGVLTKAALGMMGS
ncbi:MAG TPA: alpha/beta hydrolase [Acetobacteraceae bacterium]